jgi:hypothetical protein
VRRRQISLQHRRHQLQLVLRVPEWQDIFGGRLKLYHSHMWQRPVCFRQQLHILPGRPLPIFELSYFRELHGVRRRQDIVGGRLLLYAVCERPLQVVSRRCNFPGRVFVQL